MERLTIKGATEPVCARKCEYGSSLDCYDCDKHKELLNRLAAYEDTGLEPEEINGNIISREYAPLHHWFWVELHQRPERLKKIFDAEQEGRLVVLPCKVGDTVWGVVYDTRDCQNCVGIGGCFGCSKANPIDVYRTDFKLHMVEKIGRTLFLTREEAEKAMKGVSEDIRKN